MFIVIFVAFTNYSTFALYEQPKDVQLFLQIQVRDSDGTLITYIEGKPRIFNLEKVSQYLESISQKSTFVKNGKTYEIFRSNSESSFSQTNTMGGYFIRFPINGIDTNVMYMDHGSYHVKQGDIIKAYFTLIRSV
jgi:hypothetical protein